MTVFDGDLTEMIAGVLRSQPRKREFCLVTFRRVQKHENAPRTGVLRACVRALVNVCVYVEMRICVLERFDAHTHTHHWRCCRDCARVFFLLFVVVVVVVAFLCLCMYAHARVCVLCT